MSNIAAGSIVKFTGFKQQESIDTATVDELEQMYPSMVVGDLFLVQSVGVDGDYRLSMSGKIANLFPTFLFPNEVEAVE